MRQSPRSVEPTTAFRRDFKRESKGLFRGKLEELLRPVLTALAGDDPLPSANRDHPLTGDWNDCRECHVRGNLLLVYRKPDDARLQLVRLGSHSELFG
ncbi:MAG TPA: type II toxin-antitoxin system YafQ family toxin [Anaeromyxobacteraceae bacterium]|jgi:mRNA interferase YafQ|nr:type II toxin-antitoxin system YafQ family toxin [Anaeromyxobacteraceae bacterium]